MGATLVRCLPLAVGVAISPVILALQIAALSSKRRPKERATAVLIGVTVVAVVVVLAVAALDHHAAPTPSAARWIVAGWIRLGAAVVLLGVAAASALHRSARHQVHSGPEVGDDAGHLVRFALFGAAAMLGDSVLLLPAAHDAAVASIPVAQRVEILAIVLVVALIPAYLPLLAALVTGTWGLGQLERLRNWFTRHVRTITIVGALGIAAYLALSGFTDLGRSTASSSTSTSNSTTTTTTVR